MSDIKLTLEFQHKDPVELIVFTESLSKLASSYERFLINSAKGQAVEQQSKLYISKIRNGSIIVELVDLFPLAIGLLGEVNTIVGFSKHLKGAINFFLGKGEKPTTLEIKDIKELVNILEPVAKDRGATFNIKAENVITGDVQVSININTNEGNAIQNQAKRELEILNVPIKTNYEKVLFYWFQARADLEVKSGFTGIIDSISAKSLKVIFEEEEIKQQMLEMEENPFKMVFVVDVIVETVKNSPFAYKILNIHDIHHQ